MMGSFFTRVSLMILGYAYPAYECYKIVEMNKPEIEQLLIWCQYWILVAMLTVFERIGDAFISWLPFYGEVKLAFFIYLWHPKTKGTRYIYSVFFRPYMSKHEMEIDRTLLELRNRAVDLAALYWHKASSRGRAWFFGTMQLVVSQTSSTRVCPAEETGLVTQHAPVASFHEMRQKPELVKFGRRPSASSASARAEGGHSTLSTTAHHPPPHAEMLSDEDVTAHDHNSVQDPEETTRREEPLRIFHRVRIKKRATVAGT